MAAFRWDVVMSVLSEYDADGFLGVSHDAYGGLAAGVHPAEVHWALGTFARPRDPSTDPKGNVKLGANVLHGWEGNVGHALLLSDPRAVPKLPRLKKGGFGTYADTGHDNLPFAVMDGDDGTFSIYIPYARDGTGFPTKAMLVELNVKTPGSEGIAIVHGDGMAITMTAGGKHSVVIKNKSGNAYIELNDDGNVLNGNTVVNGGATIGSPVGALPAAIAPKLAAYIAQLEIDIGAALTAVGVGAAAAGAAGATSFAGTAGARAALVAQIPAIKTSVA